MNYPHRTFVFVKASLLWLLIAAQSIVLFAQIPQGYYSTATGTGSTLKTQLYNIIKNHTVRSYDNLWTDFQSTDNKGSNTVWDMYSDTPGRTPPYSYTYGSKQCGTYNGEGDCFNREHSVPASWFSDASPMYSDLFHLYPTDGYVNNRRGSYPFGKVNSAGWTSLNGSKVGNNSIPGYSGTVFEPVDEYKGDFARTYFYMATRYENVISGWYANSAQADAVLQNNNFPVFESWFLQMLGEWHVADPVSDKETNRNNAVYNIQGNRNPFIDHPEYVYAVWGVGQQPDNGPSNYPTNFSAHNIRLQWTDAMGEVSPDHYLIRMSSTGFGDIQAPVDGNTYPDSSTDLNVARGVQEAMFRNLQPGTTYYFKIFGYTGTGSQTNYKTSGSIPQISKSTN